MHILYNDEVLAGFDFYEEIEKCMLKTLEIEEFDTDVEISLTIVNDDAIKLLNKEHRDKDKATDVLSFPLINFDEELVFYEGEIIELGDIVISLDTAKRQAEDLNHSLKREVCFLVVHSMLHLLGYDHMTDEDEKEMIEKQNKVLNSLEITR
ncbi:MAG: rRNA maturation RNase YbeY [Clostridia bacterium]|nr:rRNA maturation RNase YbeY [Clostridia bacterium]